jgi:hypothetical protein
MKRKKKKKGSPPFVPTRDQIVDVFNNSLFYEILFTFGVPVHDPSDYCHWEAINFSRMAHARLLYDFLETPTSERSKDDVLAEDFGYPAAPIALSKDDRKRLNKDLMHLTYSRLRHTPLTRPWPDSILANLQDPVLGFMNHAKRDRGLFPSENDVRGWDELIRRLRSGKQLLIRSTVDSAKRPTYQLDSGSDLPNGKAALTKLVLAS